LQRGAVADREPPRHLGDLLIAIRLQHLKRVSVAADCGRYFFSRPAEIKQHDSGSEPLSETFVAPDHNPFERF
jgi:hypothetical protein